MPNVKFIPKNIDQVREVLIDFPADLEIELKSASRSTQRPSKILFAIHLAARLGPDVQSRGLSYAGED